MTGPRRRGVDLTLPLLDGAACVNYPAEWWFGQRAVNRDDPVVRAVEELAAAGVAQDEIATRLNLTTYQVYHIRGSTGYIISYSDAATVRQAKEICRAECPVREACLKFALENKEEFGVWGGLTAHERKRLRRVVS